MKYMTNIQPFNDYFCNCYINAIVSILSYYDESYKVAAYMNSYKPVFGWYNDQYFPYVGENDNFKLSFEKWFEMGKFDFQKENNDLEVVKKAIREKKYIFVYVDLYHWDKTGSIYGIEHLPHPSLIVGYDDVKNIFYALEDDLSCSVHYYVHEYTSEQFKEAIASNREYCKSMNDCEYKILTLNHKIEPFALSIDEVKENAKVLIDTMQGERFTSFSVHNDDLVNANIIDEYIRVHTRYTNRSIANKFLFQELNKRNYITNEQREELCNDCDRILYEIDNVKMMLFKGKVTKQYVTPGAVEEKWKCGFKVEVDMWKRFLKYLV